jgi:hypothetical protein
MSDTCTANSHLLLPPELWSLISSYLRREDWSNLRLTSRLHRELATPFLFREVPCAFNSSSISNLDTITSTEQLRQCVEHLKFYENLRLHKFFDLDEWTQSVSLPDKLTSGDDYDQEHAQDGLMSLEEWSQIQVSERKTLYDAYNRERVATRDRVRLGTSYLQLSHRLAIALKKCPRLKSFTYVPTVLSQERWNTEWQALRFNTRLFEESESFDEACTEDEDADALHLSYALRALAQAKTPLTSLAFHVEGPAFWGAHRLRRLWCDEGHDEIRRLRKIHQNADDADREASDNLDNDILEYEAQLVAMENVFTTLTQLDCCVSEDETVGGLLAASKPLTEFLCRASVLRRLHLAFGEFPNGVPKEMHLLSDYDGHGCALLGALADRRPWPCLEKLNLGVATGVPSLLRFLDSISASLSHLELNHVVLVPKTVKGPKTHSDNAGGVQEATWEYVLPKIAQCLPLLQSLDISSLCFYPGRSPLVEMLFDPQDLDLENTCSCLDLHKKAVIDELLRHKEVCQSLDCVDYIRMHCDHGDQEGADSARSSPLDELYD